MNNFSTLSQEKYLKPKYKNHSKNQNRNQNRNQEHIKKINYYEEKKRIIYDEENFPSMNLDISCNNNMINTEKYLEKIKERDEKKEREQNLKLPIGWIILKKNNENIKDKEDISEYYDPYNSYRIIENRRNDREELNNILGDISPYMIEEDEEEDENSEDEETLNYQENYSEEEEYYNEEWW